MGSSTIMASRTIHSSTMASHQEIPAAALRAVRRLSLAAAPTFAIMALLTGTFGGGPVDALCSVAGVSPLSGMLPMYLLMSAFHLAPWLKLIAGPRRS